MPRGASARLVSLGLLGLVLGTGFLMGVAWDRDDAPEGSPPPAEADDGQAERSPRVIDQVGLAEGQRADVDRIIEHYRVQMKALDAEFRTAYRPRRGDLVRAARDSIRAILSPSQTMVYDSLLEARYGSDRNESAPSQDSAATGDTGA